MAALTENQLTACKQRLSRRQGELIRQLNNRYHLEISQTDAVGELSSYDNHPADLGTELHEREKDILFQHRAEKELEDINKSLHAIADGTYGICRVCSMNIPYDRLVSKPTAETCIEHAEEEEPMATSNDALEEIVGSHINNKPTTDEETNYYDKEDAWQDVSRYGTSDTPSDLYGDHESYDAMFANSDENIGIVEDVERYAEDEPE